MSFLSIMLTLSSFSLRDQSVALYMPERARCVEFRAQLCDLLYHRRQQPPMRENIILQPRTQRDVVSCFPSAHRVPLTAASMRLHATQSHSQAR
jgi:hypothetical protein